MIFWKLFFTICNYIFDAKTIVILDKEIEKENRYCKLLL